MSNLIFAFIGAPIGFLLVQNWIRGKRIRKLEQSIEDLSAQLAECQGTIQTATELAFSQLDHLGKMHKEIERCGGNTNAFKDHPRP